MDDDQSEVQGTGRESFLVILIWRNFEDTGKDEHISQESEQECTQQTQHWHQSRSWVRLYSSGWALILVVHWILKSYCLCSAVTAFIWQKKCLMRLSIQKDTMDTSASCIKIDQGVSSKQRPQAVCMQHWSSEEVIWNFLSTINELQGKKGEVSAQPSHT